MGDEQHELGPHELEGVPCDGAGAGGRDGRRRRARAPARVDVTGVQHGAAEEEARGGCAGGTARRSRRRRRVLWWWAGPRPPPDAAAADEGFAIADRCGAGLYGSNGRPGFRKPIILALCVILIYFIISLSKSLKTSFIIMSKLRKIHVKKS